MATFKVESASKQDRMGPGASTKTVYVVWLETDKGATGSVEVSKAIWESDDLKAFLTAEAAKLDKAFDLINGD